MRKGVTNGDCGEKIMIKKIHWSQEEAHGGLAHARNGMAPGYLCQNATYGLGRRSNVDAPTKVSDTRYCARCLFAIQLLGIDKAYAARIVELTTRILDEERKTLGDRHAAEIVSLTKRVDELLTTNEKFVIEEKDVELGKAAAVIMRRVMELYRTPFARGPW